MEGKINPEKNMPASQCCVRSPVGPFPLVFIEWLDSHYRPGWTLEDSATEPLVCKSVGWLIHDGDDAKVLAAHLSNEKCPQRCGDMTIPSRAILKIKKITL